ncbi:hypothetical protein BHE74_00034230 [Ensete ventricosum]|nr:hypothetical protein BHE74_00034230 [Ensete ventricosum]
MPCHAMRICGTPLYREAVETVNGQWLESRPWPLDRVKQTIAPQGLNALCVPAVLVAHETAITADPCLGLQGANKN